jgi:hypothetical protein
MLPDQPEPDSSPVMVQGPDIPGLAQSAERLDPCVTIHVACYRLKYVVLQGFLLLTQISGRQSESALIVAVVIAAAIIV